MHWLHASEESIQCCLARQAGLRQAPLRIRELRAGGEAQVLYQEVAQALPLFQVLLYSTPG